mgnify:CR=1 FL=1
MNCYADIILSGRKRISGTKYQKCTKAEARFWAHEKYLTRMEMLREDIKLLEDDDIHEYFASNGAANLKERCQAYHILKKMAEEVIKPQPIVFEKARALQKQKKIRARRSGGEKIVQ